MVGEIIDHKKEVRVKYHRGIGRIGVLSDTHIPARARSLPPELFARLREVELILHAGDIVDDRVLVELEALAPVEAVAGNMDPPHLHERLGRIKLLHVGGYRIGLVHGDGVRWTTRRRAEEAFAGLEPAVIVFGHSHRPLCEKSGELLLFNPGSCVDPRGAGRPSYGILHLSSSGIFGEIHRL
jgi:putative phosphoesterase